jgi:nitrogenase subunit NifH
MTNPTTTRHRLRGILVALVVGSPMLVATIGIGGAGASTTPKTSKAAIAATCQRVSDILSDGPDPDADPVGYALAQVLPLRAVKTTDKALHTDIDNLASAYETVYKTNDKKGTETAVNKAGKKLDGICPGAF